MSEKYYQCEQCETVFSGTRCLPCPSCGLKPDCGDTCSLDDIKKKNVIVQTNPAAIKE